MSQPHVSKTRHLFSRYFPTYAKCRDNVPTCLATKTFWPRATLEQPVENSEENAVEVALRGVLLSKSEEEIVQDFMWQGQYGSAKAMDLRNQMLSFDQEIEAYRMVFKGSKKIKVVHGAWHHTVSRATCARAEWGHTWQDGEVESVLFPPVATVAL
eukprot:scaffold10837_cov70-Cyclotella_meneghiniana.AAC.2